MPERRAMRQHLTVSAAIVCRGHALLIHHKRIGSWLPPGGHVEPEEFPHEAVIREVMEETGVPVEILSGRLPDTDDPDAFFLPTPLCTHAVLAKEGAEMIYHVDIVYLCVPVHSSHEQGKFDSISLPTLIESPEVHAAAWIELDQLTTVPLAKNVLEVFQVARSWLSEL
jgi:8-oxo-dGTP pyrophosphatase MutT (NUDIX family)